MTTFPAQPPTVLTPSAPIKSTPEPSIESLFNLSLDGMMILDTQLNMVECNERTTIICGYAKSALIGQPIQQFLSQSAHLTKFEQKIQQLNSGIHADPNVEITIMNAEGAIIWVAINITKMTLGGATYYNLILRNLSEQKETRKYLKGQLKALEKGKRALEKMSASNTQLESFAYIASHDLKEPLRTIGNFSQMLKKRLSGKLDPIDQEFFDFIISGVQNMNTLIEDLLTYSRVNTMDHDVKVLQPVDCLAVVINSLNQKIEETGATIEIKGLPEHIIGNSTKIKQLFQNLIANAIKFRKADAPAEILVEGEEQSNCWIFRVSDNGIGIKADHFKKIFGIFTKLHRKADYPGSGIGLSVCERIVQQHNGKIWLESVPGQGTTFYFTIGKECALG